MNRRGLRILGVIALLGAFGCSTSSSTGSGDGGNDGTASSGTTSGSGAASGSGSSTVSGSGSASSTGSASGGGPGSGSSSGSDSGGDAGSGSSSDGGFDSGVVACDWTHADETLNGSAVITDAGVLHLTTLGTTYGAGSAFWNRAIAWDPTVSFSTFFAFYIGPNVHSGDGLAFVIQSSAAGTKALGQYGGYLGYGGMGAVEPSVAVEFDTFQNDWDPNANHVALIENGDVTNHLKFGTPEFELASAADVFAWIEYDAPSTTFTVYVSDVASKPSAALFAETIDVASVLSGSADAGAGNGGPTIAYVGFSAGTGTATDNDDVHQWTWTVGSEVVNCAQSDAGSTDATIE